MKGRPEDWTATVARNWPKVTAYLVSSNHPSCVRMARDEARFIDRVMVHVTLDGLDRLTPARHWFMAVVVCPGDDLTPLVAWAKARDASRIHFYLHRDASTGSLAPWRDAGLPLNRVEEERFTSYGPMHRRLGLDLSDRVYADFRVRP